MVKRNVLTIQQLIIIKKIMGYNILTRKSLGSCRPI